MKIEKKVGPDGGSPNSEDDDRDWEKLGNELLDRWGSEATSIPNCIWDLEDQLLRKVLSVTASNCLRGTYRALAELSTPTGPSGPEEASAQRVKVRTVIPEGWMVMNCATWNGRLELVARRPVGAPNWTKKECVKGVLIRTDSTGVLRTFFAVLTPRCSPGHLTGRALAHLTAGARYFSAKLRFCNLSQQVDSVDVRFVESIRIGSVS